MPEMTTSDWLLAILCYLAVAVLVLGLLRRFTKWWRSETPLNIVLTPAPKTRCGVARRLALGMLFFPALAKSSPWLWAAAWIFHVSLLLLIIGHFGGLVFFDLTCKIFGLGEAGYHQFANLTGGIFGITATLALLVLLLRRLTLERERHISVFADYFALILLLLIIGAGNHMRFLGGFSDADLVQARAFAQGLLTFQPAAPPANAVFVIHVILVSVLLIYLPFSKLVHLGGALSNPTLTQTNTPREKRHIGPWDAQTQGHAQPNSQNKATA